MREYRAESTEFDTVANSKMIVTTRTTHINTWQKAGLYVSHSYGLGSARCPGRVHNHRNNTHITNKQSSNDDSSQRGYWHRLSP